eukprot:356930-Chlamydomonas_euryale.AAC.10
MCDAPRRAARRSPRYQPRSATAPSHLRDILLNDSAVSSLARAAESALAEVGSELPSSIENRAAHAAKHGVGRGTRALQSGCRRGGRSDALPAAPEKAPACRARAFCSRRRARTLGTDGGATRGAAASNEAGPEGMSKCGEAAADAASCA